MLTSDWNERLAMKGLELMLMMLACLVGCREGLGSCMMPGRPVGCNERLGWPAGMKAQPLGS